MVADTVAEHARSQAVTPPPAHAARRVAINSLLPFGATLAGRVLAWGMAVVMARTIGPDGTGAYAVAVNLWLYASIISDFGLGTWLTREIARSPDRTRDAVRLSLGIRLVLSTIALFCLTGVAFAYYLAGHATLEIVATTAILGVGLLPGALSAAGTALFNAHERMVFPAAVQLLSAIVTIAAGAIVLLAGHGIMALGWVSLAVNGITAAVFGIASARAYVPLVAALDLPRQIALARETFPLMLNGLLNNVFFRIDIQVLQTQGTSVVGNYANAYKVTDAAGAIPSSFVLALFPLLSRRAGPAGGPGGLLSVYILALKLLLVVALPLSLVLTYVAHDLTLLSWGTAFLPHSAIALQILVWFLPLSFFNGLTQYVLIALGLQRRITLAFAMAAAFNLGANLLLIPIFGYVAAAVTTIATEVILLVPFLTALRRQISVPTVVVGAFRTLPPALALGAVLWLSSGQHQLIGLAVGCALYPVFVWLSRTFDEREWRLLFGLVRGR